MNEDAKFCKNCGATVETSRKMFCRNCGTQVIEGAQFCKNCGTIQEQKVSEEVKEVAPTPMASDVPPTPPPLIVPPPVIPKKKGGALKYVLAGIGVLIAICVGLYLFNDKKGISINTYGLN